MQLGPLSLWERVRVRAGLIGEIRGSIMKKLNDKQLDLSPFSPQGSCLFQTEGEFRMKGNIILIVLMTVCANPELPKVRYARTLPVSYYGYPPQGGQYESTITEEIRDSSPEWAEKDPNPPLSARKALDLAILTLQHTLTNTRDESLELTLDGVKLIPLGEKKWCWDVHYQWRVVHGGSSGGPPDFHVFVLMNGVVVKPEKKGDK